MTAVQLLALFVPTWAYPWLVCGAAIAWVLDCRRIALALAGILLVDLVVIPLLAPWIDQLPVWLLLLVLFIGALLVVHLAVSVLFGREAAGAFTGEWLVIISKALLLLPFRLLGWLLGSITRAAFRRRG